MSVCASHSGRVGLSATPWTAAQQGLLIELNCGALGAYGDGELLPVGETPSPLCPPHTFGGRKGSTLASRGGTILCLSFLLPVFVHLPGTTSDIANNNNDS